MCNKNHMAVFIWQYLS